MYTASLPCVTTMNNNLSSHFTTLLEYIFNIMLVHKNKRFSTLPPFYSLSILKYNWDLSKRVVSQYTQWRRELSIGCALDAQAPPLLLMVKYKGEGRPKVFPFSPTARYYNIHRHIQKHSPCSARIYQEGDGREWVRGIKREITENEIHRLERWKKVMV